MVFVIQASQNRDTRAMHLKLDELIRAVANARNEMINLEEAPDETVELHREHFKEIVDAASRADPSVLDDVPIRTSKAPPPATPTAKRTAPAEGRRADAIIRR